MEGSTTGVMPTSKDAPDIKSEDAEHGGVVRAGWNGHTGVAEKNIRDVVSLFLMNGFQEKKKK